MSMQFDLYEEKIGKISGNVSLKWILTMHGNIPTKLLLNLIGTNFTDACENYIYLPINTLQHWFKENSHDEAVGKYLDGIDYENIPETLFVKFT